MMYRFSSLWLALALIAFCGLELPSQACAQEPTGRDLDQLIDTMERGARGAAEGKNFGYYIELIEKQASSVESATGTRVIMTADYAVHMRGSIIGVNRKLCVVRVRAQTVASSGSYVPSVLGTTILFNAKK